jgi:flagellin
MGLSILSNIPSLEAQNQLAMTNTNLQNTLFQLSSGSKINSGADDPAGLSIADGLQANISALTQSAQNVTDGVGMLQTADGALSQVTTLLNRAVTLATEAGNAGLTTDQQNALQNEYQSITQEINQIGSNTTYNNNQVFTSQLTSVFLSDGSQTDAADPTISVTIPQLSASALGLSSYATGTLDLTANPQAGNSVQIGQQVYTFVTSGNANAAGDVALGSNVQGTLQNLQDAVNGTGTASPGTYGVGTAANQSAQITSVNGGSAVVQALAAGNAGNDVTLTTNLTSSSGAAPTDLTGGTATVYTNGTLSLAAQPGTLTTATGSLTMNALPDTITNATGVLNMTAGNPTAAVNASGTLTMGANQPATGVSTGTLTLTGQPTANDTVVVGSNTYTFVASGSATVAGDVAIGGTDQVSLDNLMAAVNSGGTGGSATTYAIGTVANTTARITSDAGLVAHVQSLAADPTNAMALSENIAGGMGAVSAVAGGGTADTLDLGGTTYVFVAANDATAGNEIALGATVNDTLQNLQAALAGGAGSAATFHVTGGTANTAVSMSISGGGAGTSATVAATTAAATAGNNTVFSATGSMVTNNDLTTTGAAGQLGGGVNGDTMKIGAQTYTFVASGEALLANSNYVAISGASGSTTASDIANTLTNLMNAVNGTGTASSTTFATGTSAVGTAAMVLATGANPTTATLTATTPGVGNGTSTGNSVALVATGVGADGFASDVGPTGTLSGGAAADTVTLGSSTYTFVAAGQALAAGQVAIVDNVNNTNAQNIAASLANLQNAVNGTGTAGNTTYGGTATANGSATITGVSNGVVSIEAGSANVAAPGTNGNTVQLSVSSETGSATVSGSGYLAGGSAADTATVGNVTYTFVAAGQAQAGHNDVALGVASGSGNSAISAAQATLNNLMAAVNSTAVANGSANTYTLASSSMLQGSTGATITSDANGVATVQSLTAAGMGLNAVFGAGDATGTVGGLGVSTLSGGATNTAASGMIDLAGGQPVAGNATGTVTFGSDYTKLAGNTVTLGSGGSAQTYTFVATSANFDANKNEVAVGGSIKNALQNLEDAVNGGGAAGTNYSNNTVTGAAVMGANDGAVVSNINTTTGTVTFAANNLTPATGNAVVLGATGANVTKSGATLAGGGASDTVTVGSQTYTFVAANSAVTGGNYVALGTASANGGNVISAVQATLNNLALAVNDTTAAYTGHTDQRGASTFELTAVGNVQGAAGAGITSVNGDQAVVTANTAGTAANTLALAGAFTSASNVAGSPGGAQAAGAATGLFDLASTPDNGNTVTIGSQTYTFVTAAPTAANQVLIGSSANGTLNNLKAAVNGAAGAGTTYGTGTVANASATITAVSGNQATITASTTGTGGNSIAFSADLSNGVGGGPVGTVDSNLAGGGSSVDLNSAADAQAALTVIAGAISTVAATRGAIGSSINQMNAAVQVMNNTSQNLTSSLSGIQDANIGQVVANMSKYQVLEQTGIAALTQANQQEQTVLKLLQ